MFSEADAISATQYLLAVRSAEQAKLDRLHSYLTGTQALPIMLTAGMPQEVRNLAEMSRVNVIRLPVDVLAQSLFVDGFRQPDIEGDEPVWEAWQANKMDARQTGIHRAALSYAVSYAVVTDGTPFPVIRGLSPRSMTTLWGDDPDWPEQALEVRPDGTYRLYDADAVYLLKPGDPQPGDEQPRVEFTSASPHPFPVCPIARFVNVQDVDGMPCGEVEPLIPLQDQIDHTTFDLMVAQHFGAFRQRYIMGWIADSEEQKVKVGANRFLTFEDQDVKVGEFSQTDTKNHLDSREATFRHMAILSQVPPHALLGQMANLSAEALAAAEVGQRRKLNERKTSFGESWEQTMWLVGIGMGIKIDDKAQVHWSNNEARSLSQTADALVKLDTIGFPRPMLWEMIPDVGQTDLERARALDAQQGAFGDLQAIMDGLPPAPQDTPVA